MLSQKIPWYYSLPVIILSTLLAVVLIYAWQEPTAPPPGGNVPAPLNTGSETQTKIGGLILNGSLGIGKTPETDYKLDVNGAIRGTGFCLGTDCRTSWPAIAGGYWTESGANIYNLNTGNVGIGLTNPAGKLQVRTTSTSTVPFKIEAAVGGGVSHSGSRTDTSETDWNAQSKTNLQVQDGDVLLAEVTPSYSINGISYDTAFFLPPGYSPSYTPLTWTPYRDISLPANVKAIIAHVGMPSVGKESVMSRVSYNGAQQGDATYGYTSECNYESYPNIWFPISVFDTGGGGTAHLQLFAGGDVGDVYMGSVGYYISGSGYTLNTIPGYEGGYWFSSTADDWETVWTATIPSTAREVIVFHSAMPQVSWIGGTNYYTRTRVLYNEVEQGNRGAGAMSECSEGSVSIFSIGYDSFSAGTGGTLKIQVKRDNPANGEMEGYAQVYYTTASQKYVSSGTLTSTNTSVPGSITSVTPSWNATLNGQTITVDISIDGGKTWTTNVTSGTTYSFPYSGTESQLKYRVNFSTTDTLTTPILHDITLNYTYVTLPTQKTVFYLQNQTGRVGIGTDNPQYLLDVEGDAQATAWYTGDIIFQKDKEPIWRMYEKEDGLYLENLKTGKKYKFLLEKVEEEK